MYAALWIEWKDGVAYRKGVMGLADPERPLSALSTKPIFPKIDDTVRRGVDLFGGEMVDARKR